MMIKEECKNFVKLAYLFDYIMLDILRRMFLFSMTDVLKKLDDYNEIPIPVMKKIFKIKMESILSHKCKIKIELSLTS